MRALGFGSRYGRSQPGWHGRLAWQRAPGAAAAGPGAPLPPPARLAAPRGRRPRPPPPPPPLARDVTSDVTARLHDVIHADRRLYLVFEYLDLDLKKLMDGMPGFSADTRLIKVRIRNLLCNYSYATATRESMNKPLCDFIVWKWSQCSSRCGGTCTAFDIYLDCRSLHACEGGAIGLHVDAAPQVHRHSCMQWQSESSKRPQARRLS